MQDPSTENQIGKGINQAAYIFLISFACLIVILASLCNKAGIIHWPQWHGANFIGPANATHCDSLTDVH